MTPCFYKHREYRYALPWALDDRRAHQQPNAGGGEGVRRPAAATAQQQLRFGGVALLVLTVFLVAGMLPVYLTLRSLAEEQAELVTYPSNTPVALLEGATDNIYVAAGTSPTHSWAPTLTPVVRCLHTVAVCR